MDELALFAGAGGGLLGTHHLLGWRTVCAVEWDRYRQEWLRWHSQLWRVALGSVFGDR